jgi:NAD-dependent DNA ligase
MAPGKSSRFGSRRAETVTVNSKAKAKPSRSIKQIFAGKNFSLTGDFGEAWAYDKVVNWIKVHGGKYEREVGDKTTHLVCTIEAYKKENEQGSSISKLDDLYNADVWGS